MNTRDRLPWTEETWNRIDRAVHDEEKRIKIASRFLPMYGPVGDALTVVADRIESSGADPLSVDEADTTPLVEVWTEFTLTQQQVAKEDENTTAVTLAMRATNLLAQGFDLLMFQGDSGLKTPLFNGGRVKRRSGAPGGGLLNDSRIAKAQTIDVPLADSSTKERWGEKTFATVAKAYSLLQSDGHYGPYALVLPTVPYADTFAPLEKTLIMPADRIKPLVGDHFWGTGTLPDRTGLMVSVGGNTMDLVVGKAPRVAFMQEDPDGRYRFRVFERFALRFKDASAVVKLAFK